MESEAELREHLRAADRAAAAPWVDYPPTPWWHFPLCGLWAAAMAAACGGLHEHTVQFFCCYVVLMAAMVGYLAWHRRRRGTMPHGRPPREIFRVFSRYVLGVSLVAGLAIAISTWSWICGAVVAFVLTTAGLAWYERVYGRAADRVRSRLG